MSERENPLLLLDIEQAITAILEYTEGYTFSDFEGDAKTRHAVERNFEIIGEAAQGYLRNSKRKIRKSSGVF